MEKERSSKKSTFVTLGASSHARESREKNDYYATHPTAIDALFAVEEFSDKIWESSCGEGHLSKRMEMFGKDVVSTDLVDRGFGIGGVDFLSELDTKHHDFSRDIITNPPYKYAKEFVLHALQKVRKGTKVAMLLKITFLESVSRQVLFRRYPCKNIYVFSKRLSCAKNGEFEKYPSSATCYAWFVWQKGYKGDMIIKCI